MTLYTSGFAGNGVPQLHGPNSLPPAAVVDPGVEAFRMALPMLSSLATRSEVQQVIGKLPPDHDIAPNGVYLVRPYLPNRTDPVAQGFGVWNVQVMPAGETEVTLNANVVGLPGPGGPTPEVRDRKFKPAPLADQVLALGVIGIAGRTYLDRLQRGPVPGSAQRAA